MRLLTVGMDLGDRRVSGVGLKPIEYWIRGFESR
jgi:hypothetical protein